MFPLGGWRRMVWWLLRSLHRAHGGMRQEWCMATARKSARCTKGEARGAYTVNSPWEGNSATRRMERWCVRSRVCVPWKVEKTLESRSDGRWKSPRRLHRKPWRRPWHRRRSPGSRQASSSGFWSVPRLTRFYTDVQGRPQGSQGKFAVRSCCRQRCLLPLLREPPGPFSWVFPIRPWKFPMLRSPGWGKGGLRAREN